MHHERVSLGLVHQNHRKTVWYTKDTHSTDRLAFCHWYQSATPLLSILVWVILSVKNKTVSHVSQKGVLQTQKGKLFTEFLCGVWVSLVSVECIHWNITALAASFHRTFGSPSKKFPPHSQTRCIIYHVTLFLCTVHQIIQGLLTKCLSLFHLEYYRLVSYLLATHCQFPKAFLTLFPL